MDFNSIKGQEILDRISRHCPESLTVYLHCANRACSGRPFFFSRELIEEECTETRTRFRNNLKKLSLENMVEFFEIDNGFSVTLLEQDYDE